MAGSRGEAEDMNAVDLNLSGGSAVESARTQETQRPGPAAGNTTAAPTSGRDRVEFSGTLGSLARAMATFQANQSSKVGALASQYQSGAYRTDSLATSRAMIGQALNAVDD